MTIKHLALALAAATSLSPALAQSKGDDQSVTQSNADKHEGGGRGRLRQRAGRGAGGDAPRRGDGRRAARCAYTATAGTLTMRDVEGKPTASMFYTAYTLDGGSPARSGPVTFFYNGGPGSPTFWLHMGSFAPIRLKTGNPEFIRPAPYDVGPNPDTLLDKTDMVFLDAIGRGLFAAAGRHEARAPSTASTRMPTSSPRRSCATPPNTAAGTAPSSCSAKATARCARARSPISCRSAGWRSTASSCSPVDHELRLSPAGARPGLSQLPAELRRDRLVP